MKTSMWHQPGGDGNDTLVVLKCPGKDELIANRPVAGKTGENLCFLFRSIDQMSHGRVSLCKRDVEIVNASRIPHFKGSPFGDEVTQNEVMENKEFVLRCLRNEAIKRVFCCGKHAKALVRNILDENQEISQRVSVVYICHLGDQGIADGQMRYLWPKGVDGINDRLKYIAKNIPIDAGPSNVWSLPHGSGYREYLLSTLP